MFCPSCGLNDENSNQFCRACGTNLAPVRNAVERGDALTQSAANARDEIGRAFAARIRQAQTAAELKMVAEDVLPKVEEFLESPEEKKLRRIRTGSILGGIGAGAAIPFGIIAAILGKEEFFFLGAAGVVCFFIGLSFIVNAIFASVPKKLVADRSEDAERQAAIDRSTSDLQLPESRQEFVSVIEETTRNLQK